MGRGGVDCRALSLDVGTERLDVGRRCRAVCPPFQQFTDFTGDRIAAAQGQLGPELHRTGVANDAATLVELVGSGAIHRAEHTFHVIWQMMCHKAGELG